MRATSCWPSALVLTPVAAFADLAISGQDGKQVRAGDGLPMVPTPDSVATIAFSSSDAPKVIGMIEVCSTQMGPPSALAVAPDYSFVLATCPQKFGAGQQARRGQHRGGDRAGRSHPAQAAGDGGSRHGRHRRLS